MEPTVISVVIEKFNKNKLETLDSSKQYYMYADTVNSFKDVDIPLNVSIGLKLPGLICYDHQKAVKALKDFVSIKNNLIKNNKKFVLFDPLLGVSLFTYEKFEGIGTLFIGKNSKPELIDFIKKNFSRGKRKIAEIIYEDIDDKNLADFELNFNLMNQTDKISVYKTYLNGLK